MSKKIYNSNISKSKKILGWKPKYSIKESVKLTVNWYKNTHLKKTSVEEETIKQISDYMNSM